MTTSRRSSGCTSIRVYLHGVGLTMEWGMARLFMRRGWAQCIPDASTSQGVSGHSTPPNPCPHPPTLGDRPRTGGTDSSVTSASPPPRPSSKWGAAGVTTAAT